MVRRSGLVVRSRWPMWLSRWLLRRKSSHLLHHLYLGQGCCNEFIFAMLLEFALNGRVPVVFDVVI